MTEANTPSKVIAVHGMKPTALMSRRRDRRQSAKLLIATTMAENKDIEVQN